MTIQKGRLFEAQIVLSTPPLKVKSGYRSSNSTTRGSFTILGNGAESIDVPFSAFDHYYPFLETFYAIQDVVIRGQFRDGLPGTVTLKRVRVVQAPSIKLYSSSRSRVGEESATVDYKLAVMNCTDRSQSVVLSHAPYSKHVMTAVITPDRILLKPGETQSCTVRVGVTDRVPPGGRERQNIIALANGSLGGELEFITGPKAPPPLPGPYPERMGGNS